MRFSFDPSSGVGPDQSFRLRNAGRVADQDYGERRNRPPLRAGNRPLEAQRANPSGSRRTTALQRVLGLLITIWPISGASRALKSRARPPELETICRRRCELW
jgi:hypothetical protein